MTKIALAHDHLFQIGGAENVLVVLSSMHKEAPIFTLINNSKIGFLYNLLGLILVGQTKYNDAIKYYQKGIEIIDLTNSKILEGNRKKRGFFTSR